MKKTLTAILPFLCMFVIATGSVVVSCATAPGTKGAATDAEISINTDIAREGKLRTVWVLESIQSILIVDANDRSRQVELSADEWAYDAETTELTVLKAISFDEYFANVEGTQKLPHAFVLDGIKDQTELMVIMRDRLAIEGYDYDFNAEKNLLTFRDDVTLKDEDWSVQYTGQYGGVMFGEWRPENEDRLSYLMAEHQKRWLDSWYDRQTAFWFLDESRMDEWKADRKLPPPLILRAATPKELDVMKSTSSNVMKLHTNAKDKAVSREIGFDSRVPERLVTDSPHAEYPLFWKAIEESSRGGILARTLVVVYEDGTGNGLSQYVVHIRMDKLGPDEHSPQTEWTIDEQTIDLGIPVRVSHWWGTQSTDLNEKPTVIAFTTWSWSDETVRYEASGDSANDERSIILLRQFIAKRMKKN